MKNNYLYLFTFLLALLITSSCTQEKEKLQEQLNTSEEPTILLSQEDPSELVNDYILLYNELSKKMYDAHLSVTTLNELNEILSSPDLTETQQNEIFSDYFSISDEEIAAKDESYAELLLYYEEDDLAVLISNRVEELYNSGILDISYYDDFYTNLQDENQAAARIPCWRVALNGIGGGALLVAGGATHGNGFAMAWGFVKFVDAVATMASGGCT